MKVEVTESEVIIRLPRQAPTPSKSGKALLVAHSHGYQKTTQTVDGKPLSVNAMATIPARG